MSTTTQPTAELCRLTVQVGRLYTKRLLDAQTRYLSRLPGPASTEATPGGLATPWDAWRAWSSYATDVAQRSVLFWDTIRRRGNQFLDHERAGKPPVLALNQA